ncbi:MAG TPA: hypothetical protein VGO11_17875 [Chthoniobacteraceae bacterium]|jgi:hypothetical protein|nr:hypothetical protein [Chthoniobacteraceae bacterium]
MLKLAAYVCVIAALVAGGMMLGYQKGLAAASRPGEPIEQPAPPPIAVDDPTPSATALMQRAAAPSFTLDSSPKVALFGVLDVANQHLVVTGSATIRAEDFKGDGKFNFNIGYQF